MKSKITERLVAYSFDNVVAALDRYSLELSYFDSLDWDTIREEMISRPQPEFRPKIPQSGLSTIQAAVTTECNCRCSYCQLYGNPLIEKGAYMDRNVADSILSRLHELGQDALLIVTGGEPLLNWEVTRHLLTEAKCLKVLFTNGTLITEEIAVILRETSTCVIVSLDGRHHEHNAARRYCLGGGDTYLDVEKGISIAKNAECRIGLSLVAGHHNVYELSNIFAELVTRFAPESFGFNLQHYASGSDKKFPVRAYADELTKIFSLAKTAGVYVDQVARKLKPLVTRSFKYHDCAACGSKLVVYPSGKTSNCINYIAYSNGNDSNIWQERTPVTISGCKDCEAIGICGGGCPYDGLSYNNAGSVDRRNCIVTKKLLKTFVQDIYKSRKEFGRYQDISDIYSEMLTRGGISISIGHEIPKDKAIKGSAWK